VGGVAEDAGPDVSVGAAAESLTGATSELGALGTPVVSGPAVAGDVSPALLVPPAADGSVGVAVAGEPEGTGEADGVAGVVVGSAPTVRFTGPRFVAAGARSAESPRSDVSFEAVSGRVALSGGVATATAVVVADAVVAAAGVRAHTAPGKAPQNTATVTTAPATEFSHA
jgi:hypothetical protein